MPWNENRNNDTRERNKRLTEECIAKLELNSYGADEITLMIPSTPIGGRVRSGVKPPYFQEVKAHLQNYPKLWELVQDLPILYRNTKLAYDSVSNEIRKELENVATTKNLTFPHETRDDVVSKLTNRLCTDIMNVSNPIGYSVREMPDRVGEVSIGALTNYVPVPTAKVLADKMTELSKDSAYRQKFKTVKDDFDQVSQKKAEFIKERDAIVEEIRLSNYKNLKGTPWWKQLHW